MERGIDSLPTVSEMGTADPTNIVVTIEGQHGSVPTSAIDFLTWKHSHGCSQRFDLDYSTRRRRGFTEVKKGYRGSSLANAISAFIEWMENPYGL